MQNNKNNKNNKQSFRSEISLGENFLKTIIAIIRIITATA